MERKDEKCVSSTSHGRHEEVGTSHGSMPSVKYINSRFAFKTRPVAEAFKPTDAQMYVYRIFDVEPEVSLKLTLLKWPEEGNANDYSALGFNREYIDLRVPMAGHIW